jgi:tRNA nucleotidyltransferase (CCA-adding enzyme)
MHARCTLHGMSPDSASRSLGLDEIPASIRAAALALAQAGEPAYLVGAGVRAWLAGERVRDFEILTAATGEQLLAIFEHAVPESSSNLTLMLPTAGGPVDITRWPPGGSLESELGHRDFTLHAMAYDPVGRRLIDPFGGEADWIKGVLRAVGDARERMAEDPLRALRAARLVAELGVRADPSLEHAMREAAPRVAQVARSRIRQELRALLLGRDVAEGLRLLRRGGVEDALAPGVLGDAPSIVARLPCDLTLRLAGWLRGANATRILRRLRYPREHVARIERMLALHPIDAPAHAALDARLHRLARREPLALRGLLALRHAELAERPEDAEALDRLCARIDALERTKSFERQRGALALQGRAVMEHLGCGPGPRVGRALRFLSEAIAEDPARNEPAALRALLDTWRDEA